MPTVRVLGPVDVIDGAGMAHMPTSPIRFTLLALLGLRRGDVVESEELLDQAWNGDPPESGLRALRFHISRLRAELCVDDLIITVGSGYRLNADTDLALVERAMEQHDDDAELGPVLALWRGQPLTGCSHATVLEHEHHRLEEMRLALTQRHYRHRLDGGDVGIVADLTRLCLDHPLREDLWTILISAHYKAGHQAEALRTYGRLRVNLRDELGVDPSPETRDLEARILKHDVDCRSNTSKVVRRSNLPRRNDSVIGRDDDVARIVERLGEHRLVTVTGPGGVGKTTVVLTAAHALAATGREVWWCDLAVAVASDVAFRAGEAVGLGSGPCDATSVADALAVRRDTCVVLDNCEHVADEVVELANEIMKRSDVDVITTSRIPLPLRDGVEIPLEPLDPDSTAAELFLDVAERSGGTVLRNRDDDLIRSICRRLDGIPLAIELTASRTRALSLDDIDRRLRRLLDTAPSVAVSDARHQTMTSAIETSVSLLDPHTAAALGTLAVFAGGFDLEAAEAVLDDELDVIGAIEHLVTQNLLTVDQSAPTARYRLLEPIRDYAHVVLWHDQAATRDRHLEHYLARLEAAHDVLGTSSCTPLIQLAERDADNLRALHDWALASDRIADDLRLYRPLASAWIHEWTWVGRAAEQTIDRIGVVETTGWGAACHCARSAAVVRADHPAYSRILALRPADPLSHPDADFIALNDAFHAMTFDNDFALARDRFEHTRYGDPYTTFAYHYFASLLPVYEAEAEGSATRPRAETEALAIVDAGVRWARDIGATNYEGALLQQRAQFMIRFGNVAEAVKAAHWAHELGVAAPCAWAEHTSKMHLADATLLDPKLSFDSLTMVLDPLEDALRHQVGTRVQYLMRTAARLLAADGRHDLAAECSLVEVIGRFDYLPRLALDDIPPDVWERAASAVASTSPFDIGRRAADALSEMAAKRE